MWVLPVSRFPRGVAEAQPTLRQLNFIISDMSDRRRTNSSRRAMLAGTAAAGSRSPTGAGGAGARGFLEMYRSSAASPAYANYRGRLAARLTHETQDYLSALAAGFEGQEMSVATRVLHGDPAAKILAAADTPDTLIAMSSHGRSGMGHWALGSIINKVLHATRTRC
jgi:nucleotide-binding universal stress UspA family protein